MLQAARILQAGVTAVGHGERPGRGCEAVTRAALGGSPPCSPGSLVRKEQVMDTVCYTLIWFSMDSMDASKLTPVRRQIEDKIKEPQEAVEIDIWLESPGGDA